MKKTRLERGLRGAPLRLASGATTDDQVARYNAVVKPPVAATKESLLVRGMYLMNDLPMVEGPGWIRSFDAAAIRQGAPLIIGKPLLASHTEGVRSGLEGLPQGRFFDSAVDGGPPGAPAGSSWLACLFGMPADELGRTLAGRIDLGVIGESSPTIMFDRLYCNICGADDLDCVHVPGKLYGSTMCRAIMSDIRDIEEGSMVAMGQQRATSYFLAASRSEREEAPETTAEIAALMAAREVDRRTPWQRMMGATP